MLRKIALAAGILVTIAAGTALAQSFTHEVGVDRPGSDYSQFSLPPDAGASTCLDYCRADARCLAYTYVVARPEAGRPLPLCWLKNAVPPAVPNSDCTSGVRN